MNKVTSYRSQVAQKGEEIACNYLKNKGYKILDRNFRTSDGEVDIIAQDKENIVFLEVKARTSSLYGAPLEAVNYHKQKKLVRLALYYIKKYLSGRKGGKKNSFRFDVLSILFEGEDKWQIEHIENAFFVEDANWSF